MIKLLQTERTFDVSLPEGNFTVVLMEDWGSNQIEWEVWDDSGNLVSGKRELRVIEEVEQSLT